MQALAEAAEDLAYATMFGGNGHMVFGLVRHPRPFAVVLPDSPDLLLDGAAELVSHGYLESLPSADEPAPAPERVLRYVIGHDDDDGRDLCPLFDAAWYRRQFPLAGDGASPLDHYVRIGAARRASPHPLLDPASVGEGEPIAACLGGMVASPHPLFDAIHLAPRLPDGGTGPLLLFYLADPAASGADPHPLFDAARYRSSDPPPPAGVPPLVHFIAEGWRDDRNPHPLFDVAHYRGQLRQDLAATDDPLSHDLREGWLAGLDPHPLFDTRYYLAVNADVREAGFNPLIHYVLYGAREGRNPHGYFDTGFYRSAYMGDGGGEPLADFLAHGTDGSRHPSRGFDARAYLSGYPDVAAAGLNPLLHFVLWGRREHRRMQPLSA